MTPLLDLDLARSINEGIAYLLRQAGPDGSPFPEDHPAPEIARDLPRREPREILYLPDLAIEPAWPPIAPAAFRNREQILIRVATARDHVTYAAAVFTGRLVHWRHVAALVPGGELSSRPLQPDEHFPLGLEIAEKLVKEKGLTIVPAAALSLRFSSWTLGELLDPTGGTVSVAREEATAVAALLRKAVRSPASAYDRLWTILRMGYDLGTLADALQGREPTSLVELHRWLEERAPPFAWTRDLHE